MIPRRMQIAGNVGLSGTAQQVLWTFTLVEAVAPLDYRRHWNRLLTYLRRACPAWAGTRVHELFPGRWDEFSHGVHTHVLSNTALSRKKARLIAYQAGWGRVSCKPVDYTAGAVGYCCKYLGKRRPSVLKGWRLAVPFGIVSPVRLIDIVKTTALTEAWAHCAKSPYFGKLGFREKVVAALDIRHRMLLGLIPCESFRCFSGIRLDLIPF